MSSISADYSPTSNYSYPTEISLSPSSPTGQSQTYSENLHPPRLSSPHIFRDIFAREVAGPSSRSLPRLPPLQEINFDETMQDVNRALQSANRAIQTAQAAFQTRRTPSTNMNNRQNVVDLTGDPTSPLRDDSTDSFLTQTLHPHDSRSTGRIASGSLNQPIYPGFSQIRPSFVEEEDPTSPYVGQSDSLAAAQRRYATQGRFHNRSQMSIPNMERTLVRTGIPDVRRQEEEAAIRRQRIAREQWEQNQQRQQQRDRLQQQRDRIIASSGHSATSQAQTQESQAGASSQLSNTSSAAVGSQQVLSLHRPPSSSSSTSSSVEAVDLTSVNNRTDLAAALLHSQASNPIADPTASSTQPRSALTAYKCPICLEPPRNATSTICGHLFCHECILETLKNSENIRREEAPPHRKVKGQCPVCRKELARKEEEGVTRTLVPLEIKLISKKQMEALRLQEKKRQRETEKQNSKGKGKEVLDAEDEIFELSSDGENGWGNAGSGQKASKAKRVKLSASEELDQELFGTFTYEEQG